MVPNRVKHQSCFLYCGCTTFHFPKRFSEPPRKSKFSDPPQQIFSDFQNFFKACARYLHQILIFFHQMIALQKLWKMLFISSKKLFSFSRYSNFCISVLPSFSNCRPLLWRMMEDKSQSSWCHQLSK